MIVKQFGLAWAFMLSASSVFAAGFDKPFPFFEGQVRVPVGNHGSASVEVLDHRQLKATNGYGPHTDELTLDLDSGVIEWTTVDYTPNETVKKSTLLPADQGGAYLPYRRQLAGMVGDVTWITQNLHYLSEADQAQRKPEMEAVQTYLNERLAHEDSVAPESVDLTNIPRDLRRGSTQTVVIEYLARDARDLLVETFDRDWHYLGGTKARVAAGRDQTNVSLSIPADAPLDQPGYIAVKLVPVNADWTQKLAETSKAVTFKKTQLFTSVNASWITYNGPRVGFYVNYYCEQNCSLRLDIYDASGKWLAGQSAPVSAPYIPGAEQFSSLYVNAPAPLFTVGQTYGYTVKLVPQNEAGQAYDSFQGSFTAN